MKRIKAKWAWGIGVIAFIGAALWMRELASWRPKLVGILGGWPAAQLSVSRDGRFLWAGEVGSGGRILATNPAEANSILLTPEGRAFAQAHGLESWPRVIRGSGGTTFQLQPGAKLMWLPVVATGAFSRARGEIISENLDDAALSSGATSSGTLSIWSLSDHRLKRRVRYVGIQSAFDAFSPDGRWLISVESGGAQAPAHLRRYDVQSGKAMAALDIVGVSSGFIRPRFSPDGRFLLVNSDPFTLRAVVFDARTWKPLWHVRGIVNANADWLPDNSVGITRSGVVEWCDAATGKVVRRRSGLLPDTQAWTTSPDGKWIYTIQGDGAIFRWRAG